MAEPSSENATKQNKTKATGVLNTVLNTVRKIKSFSVEPEDFPVLEEFEKIAEREAGKKGFSKVLVKGAIKEYNQKHRIGNPQKLLFPVILTSHELQTKWQQCISSINDYQFGTEYPFPLCSALHAFVGLDFRRCQNCSQFKKRM